MKEYYIPNIKELKKMLADHLGLKPGEELDTTDAYAVEQTVKNIKQETARRARATKKK